MRSHLGEVWFVASCSLQRNSLSPRNTQRGKKGIIKGQVSAKTTVYNYIVQYIGVLAEALFTSENHPTVPTLQILVRFCSHNISRTEIRRVSGFWVIILVLDW